MLILFLYLNGIHEVREKKSPEKLAGQEDEG